MIRIGSVVVGSGGMDGWSTFQGCYTINNVLNFVKESRLEAFHLLQELIELGIIGTIGFRSGVIFHGRGVGGTLNESTNDVR